MKTILKFLKIILKILKPLISLGLFGDLGDTISELIDQLSSDEEETAAAE
ncbi:MAG: hypothetical protein LUG85_02710 [Clostridiales bacterium]|nr:hypothetical protein [Clostridiales bacterium]MCD7827432.1 hypothetical protein [Clostridiales bacterium]